MSEPVQPDILTLFLAGHDERVNYGTARQYEIEAVSWIRDQQVTIATLRTWLNALEWSGSGGIADSCPMCSRPKYRGHDPQCSWVEDRAALGEVHDD